MTKNNTATILIVDDDADICELMKIFLEATGYRVNVALDGYEALEQLQAGTKPALILLDLMMPRMDGEEFMTQMRSRRLPKTPVVIMSGHSVAERNANRLGAAGCLMKPVELDALLKTVQRLAPASSKNHRA
jgi:CheY-like chemotaxis protein